MAGGGGAGAWMLAEGVLFLLVLGFGLFYLWRRGALTWEEGLRRDGEGDGERPASAGPESGGHAEGDR